MNKILKSTLVAMSMTALLSGCQTTQRTNAMTGEQETNSTTKGIFAGCVGGAVIGAIANDGKGAAIGCAAGGAAGGVIGYQMDQQEEALRQELVGTGVQIKRVGEDKIELILAGDISFSTGSTRLAEGIKPALRSVVKVMNEFEDTDLIVSGHTDSVGSESSNQQLSKTRAMAVQNYLSENGLAYGRTHAQGFGELMPKCSNDTVQGKACNRRVELTIVPAK
ncbi:MAG: hypothetical protein CL760_12775 [Chloroflexi bacterium]|nr:hypothetical protein [Chloroflexota bacterium]